MSSLIAGISSFTKGIFSADSRFDGTCNRCVTASFSEPEVGGVDTCELAALGHVMFEEAHEEEGEVGTRGGGQDGVKVGISFSTLAVEVGATTREGLVSLSCRGPAKSSRGRVNQDHMGMIWSSIGFAFS
jgi:hypothetical protein